MTTDPVSLAFGTIAGLAFLFVLFSIAFDDNDPKGPPLA